MDGIYLIRLNMEEELCFEEWCKVNTEQYVTKLRNILSKEEFNIVFDKIFDEAKKKFKNSNDEQLKKYSRS